MSVHPVRSLLLSLNAAALSCDAFTHTPWAPSTGRVGEACGEAPGPADGALLLQDGDVQRHLYLQDVLMQVADAPEKPRVPAFACQVAGCCQVFDALDDYEHHYHTLHGNVCSFCKRAFPSGHLLDAHILEWHDSLFQILSERQDMYQCLVEGCTEKFKTSRDRKDHLVRMHLYPVDFRFDKPKKSRSPTSAEVPGDSEERSEGEAMEICSEPVAASPAPAGERRTYSHRIPSTICFGQGAARGFKSNKKKTKQC
ncbi:PREDICTED: zinc finger protein 511 [Mandrillus leucophaeus]|uniref:zinc finger protein 511 n=1 Tax=Mandrillus leucophaeus TaxID=9568 RepID=UPI0005F37ED6|nr:PREDICTED: zinc finger protein 511 [Mandrillus leucophaeus]